MTRVFRQKESAVDRVFSRACVFSLVLDTKQVRRLSLGKYVIRGPWEPLSSVLAALECYISELPRPSRVIYTPAFPENQNEAKVNLFEVHFERLSALNAGGESKPWACVGRYFAI